MTIIITMAGKYERFRSAGFGIPKYLLPYGCRSILSEILFQAITSNCNNIYLVANVCDARFMGHVRKIMEKRGINKNNLIAVGDTSGQAETALRALEAIQPEGPVAFMNADTILYGRNMVDMAGSDGYIDVFRSNNHNYSYVVAKDGFVSVIGEKVLVSDLATSGLYGFSEPGMFRFYYDGEKFISEVYKNMIAAGMKVRIGEVHDEKDTIVLGTPEDYLKRSMEL